MLLRVPRSLLWGALGLMLAASAVLQFMLRHDVTDDAYFTFRYVENWLNGHGLVYNVGERLEAISNPLWMYLLAAGKFLTGAPLPLLAWGLGLLLTLGTIGGIYLISRQLEEPRRTPVFFWSSILLLASPGVQVYAGLGLEPPLLMCLLTLTAALTLRARTNNTSYIPAALCLALVGITRPEGLLYGFLWLLILPAPYFRRALIGMVIVAPAALYTLFRLSYYGLPLPYTFYAKPPNVFGYSMPFVAGDIFMSLLPAIVPFVVMELVGRCGPTTKAPSHAVLVRSVTGLMAAALIFQLYARSDWMLFARFMTPILPLLLVWGCSLCFARGEKGAHHVLLLVGTIAATAHAAYTLQQYYKLSFTHTNAAIMRGTALKNVGQWAAQHLPAGSLIVGDTTGTLSYYNLQSEVRDLSGLTDSAQLKYTLERLQAGDSYLIASGPNENSPLMQRHPAAVQDINLYIKGKPRFEPPANISSGYRCILREQISDVEVKPAVLTLDLWVRNDLVQPDWPRCAPPPELQINSTP